MYKINIEHPILFSDHYNEFHSSIYKDHRHDESVSGCLVKLNGNLGKLLRN